MPRPRSLRPLLGVALLAVIATADVRPARAGDAWQVERTSPHPGVEVSTMLRAQSPLVVHAVRISPDAPVELTPVLASGRVGDETAGRGHVPTSSMCDRANGIVCVNADYNACVGCREPFGGVVRHGRVLRSFNAGHEQLSVGPRGLTTERVQWSGVLRASYAWHQNGLTAGLGVAPARASATSSVDLARLNVRTGGDETVAYTSDWAPTAPAPAGAAHLSLLLSGPLVPGSLAVTSAEWTNTSPIPDNGVVVVASGTSAERLRRFWDEWLTTDADERVLVIETAMSQPIETSVGGHPVLLRGGQVLELDQRDPKVRDRHPRTLAGWTGGGDLFLLTVDGRQPGYSQGVTLVEAQQLLLSLGAVDGINLDGGGSSTFVGACGSRRCVRNRPSDGRERRVTVALAVVAAPGTALPVAPDLPPPPDTGGPAPASDPTETAPEPDMAPPTPSPPPAPVAATSPAQPSPVAVAVVPDVPAPASVPTGNDQMVISLRGAATAPTPPEDRLAPPLAFPEVVALAIWLVAGLCTAAISQRWVRHR